MGETASSLGRAGPLAGRHTASVTPLTPLVRFSLRASPDVATRIATVFGVTPGRDACRAVEAGDRAALWLGPDEWLLIAAEAEAAPLAASLEAALGPEPHSLVDVSHRNSGFVVAGEGAEQLLAEGCPLDLAPPACPVGFSSRTVLGKAEVVLWRRAEHVFHLECWRSFAPYLSAFLAQATQNQA